MASMLEIVGYAYSAGLRNPTELATAGAIAVAESGGNVRAYNGNGRDNSYGLWQINMKPSEVGDRKSYLGITSNEQLYDPITNAKAMVKISNSGENWKPWTTYRGLKYYASLPAAQAATAVIIADPSKAGKYVAEGAEKATGAVADATGIGAVAQAVSEAVQTPVQILNWLKEPGTWIRIAYFGAGAALIVGGLILFAKPVVSGALGQAADVLPVGKIVGKVGKAVS